MQQGVREMTYTGYRFYKRRLLRRVKRSFLKVGGDAYITLSWDGKASEKIDIFHSCASCRFPFVRTSGNNLRSLGGGGGFDGRCIPTYSSEKKWLATRSSGGSSAITKKIVPLAYSAEAAASAAKAGRQFPLR
jgi:hypothetical protein